MNLQVEPSVITLSFSATLLVTHKERGLVHNLVV
jgi:hypothetical protein